MTPTLTETARVAEVVARSEDGVEHVADLVATEPRHREIDDEARALEIGDESREPRTRLLAHWLTPVSVVSTPASAMIVSPAIARWPSNTLGDVPAGR